MEQASRQKNQPKQAHYFKRPDERAAIGKIRSCLGLESKNFKGTLEEIMVKQPEEVVELLKALMLTCLRQDVDLQPLVDHGHYLAEKRLKEKILPTLLTATTEKENVEIPAEAGKVEEAKEEPPRKM
jgi:hypothetical protein